MPARLIAARLPQEPAAVGIVDGIWANGDALLPLDPALTAAELAPLLARFRPHVLLDGGREKPLHNPASIAPGTALVITTSGTTGSPKGVVLSRAALDAAVALTNEAVGASSGDRWLCCLPLNHIAGFMTLVRSRALDADPIVHRSFDVEAVASDKEGAFVSLVPTMLYRLLEADVDLTRFSRVLVGGAAVDDALIARARAMGVRATVTYGMTETCGGMVYDGIPLPKVEVALARDGRISIASPTLMDGYRLYKSATDSALASGRFVTQDRGEWTDDGRLRVIGRLDRVIICGGKKVEPDEVEDALRAHPGVLDVVVAGEGDELWGQLVVATVTPTDQDQPPDPEQLREFLRGRISSYKIPRVFRTPQS